MRQRITGSQRIITSDSIAGLPLNWQIPASDAWLTNDGAVLVTWLDDHNQAHFGIVTADGLRTLDTAKTASTAWIDPTGRWVVYVTGERDRFNGLRQDGLHVIDLSSNLDRVVTLPANSPASTGVIFDDLGQTLTLKPQAATVRLQDLAVNSVALPEDTRDFTMSGDGTRLFALTYTGRLLRKDLLTGKVEVLCGKTPDAPVSQRLVPGSLASAGVLVFPAIRIIAVDPNGQALEPLIPASAASVYLDPKELGLSAPSTPTYEANGLSVLINETPVPLWSIARNEIRFQLPWTFPVTSAQASIRVVSADSPFEVTRQVNVATRFLAFETAATNSKIIHQDNRGVVTSADPAVPGEIVQAYMTGLNLPSAPPPDGMLPPSAVPAVNPNCSLFGRNIVEIPLSGPAFLSAQFLGIYQFNFRVPDVVPGDYIILCRDQPAASSYPFFIGAPR